MYKNKCSDANFHFGRFLVSCQNFVTAAIYTTCASVQLCCFYLKSFSSTIILLVLVVFGQRREKSHKELAEGVFNISLTPSNSGESDRTLVKDASGEAAAGGVANGGTHRVELRAKKKTYAM